MRLICHICSKSRLVHSGHYWRYGQPKLCECGGRLHCDKDGLRQLRSRDASMREVMKIKRTRD